MNPTGLRALALVAVALAFQLPVQAQQADAGAAPAQAAPPPAAPPPAASPPAAPAFVPGLSAERLAAIQAALQAARIDAWLLTDFRHSDPIALHVLGLDGPGDHISTRRWFCLIPARGQVQKLVSAVEPTSLDAVPGASAVYPSWRVRDRELGRMLRGLAKVALDYSPRSELPMISRVDAGTVELLRAMGPELVSSSELIAQLESTLDAAQLAGQARAADLLTAEMDATAQEAARRLRIGSPASERELQDFLLARQAAVGLTSEGRAIVAVDAHSALPHYSPPETGSALAGKNSVLLIDAVAKLPNDPRAIPADLTRVYFLGERVPDEVARVAAVVFKARDAAVELLRFRAEWSKPVTGAEVDHAARKVVTDAGQGERFLHRTGHSIGVHGHGEGVNNDDLETHDTRRHLPDTCFSVEPGVYVANRFGIRSEINVCLIRAAHGKLQVDVRGGPLQASVPALLP